MYTAFCFVFLSISVSAVVVCIGEWGGNPSTVCVSQANLPIPIIIIQGPCNKLAGVHTICKRSLLIGCKVEHSYIKPFSCGTADVHIVTYTYSLHVWCVEAYSTLVEGVQQWLDLFVEVFNTLEVLKVRFD